MAKKEEKKKDEPYIKPLIEKKRAEMDKKKNANPAN
jgi:hypothetical protein